MSAAGSIMKAGESLVLDSCAVIAHFKRNSFARECMEKAGLLYLPLTAFGELYYGALKAPRQQYHLDELQTFLEAVTLFYPSSQTAQTYAEIRVKLAIKGLPIPENDIWIAAVALQLQLPLLTNDEHFNRIEALKTIKF